MINEDETAWMLGDSGNPKANMERAGKEQRLGSPQGPMPMSMAVLCEMCFWDWVWEAWCAEMVLGACDVALNEMIDDWGIDDVMMMIRMMMIVVREEYFCLLSPERIYTETLII